MIEKHLIGCCMLIFFYIPVFAQDSPVHLDAQQYGQLERIWTKYHTSEEIFPSFRTLSRKRIARYLTTLPLSSLSEREQGVVHYFVNDNPEWFSDTAFLREQFSSPGPQTSVFVPDEKSPLLNTFYRFPGEMLFVRKKDFFMALNPVIQWKLGHQNDGRNTIFENRKGLALRLGVQDKIFIDTKIEDIQFARPQYMAQYTDRYGSPPGYTFYTGYRSTIAPNIRGKDVFNAEASLTFPIGKYVFTQFGYNRQFIGNGVQSLLLSDFGGNYLNLKFDLEIWRLHYQYMMGELSGKSARQVRGDQLLPKKFMAMHFLQFRLWDKAHIGLFESVVFNRGEQLEWHYLLPVVFFRSVERAIGSPDNILLGLDFNATFFKRMNLYSQFVLDEFRSSELFGGHHWWANKWGFQLGLKAFDILNIENLNATAEYNTVRPYTYSHRDSLATYTHYNSPLAHPLGANFREYIARLDYSPHKKWSLFGLIYHHRQGVNDAGINYGSDIRISNLNRPGDYGIRTGQGRDVRVTGYQGGVSYMLWHNAFLDINIGIRQENKNNNGWGSVAFRLNAGRTGNSIF